MFINGFMADAGKTTMIRIMLTLIKATGGNIRVFGIDAVSHPDKVREMPWYVPQEVSVDGELTGYENMQMYARLYDVPRASREGLILEALTYLDLADRCFVIVFFAWFLGLTFSLSSGFLNHPESVDSEIVLRTFTFTHASRVTLSLKHFNLIHYRKGVSLVHY